jgi:GxxExxY protein
MNAQAQNQNQNAASPKNYTSTLDVPTDVLTHEIIGAGIEVHRHLGPGLLEAPYERALCFELDRREIPFRSQVPIPLTFKGDNVGDYYADLIVADRVLIEIKSVVALGNAHLAQILSYLATTKLRIGLLLNFNVPVLVRGGVKRVVR